MRACVYSYTLLYIYAVHNATESAISTNTMSTATDDQNEWISTNSTMDQRTGKKTVFAEHDKVKQFETILAIVQEKAAKGKAAH